MPVVQNRDGEALKPTKVRFPIIATSKELTQALDGIQELDRNEDKLIWSWLPCASEHLKEGAPINILGQLFLREKALILEVNSTERAHKGDIWLAEKLCNLVGNSLTTHEKLTDIIGGTTPIDSSMDLKYTEEGQHLIKTHLDKHYRHTLDEPIPMLNDKTPRECASDPELHKEVVRWLKQIESESAQAPSQAYDFSWIWEDLNLGKYK